MTFIRKPHNRGFSLCFPFRLKSSVLFTMNLAGKITKYPSQLLTVRKFLSNLESGHISQGYYRFFL